MSDSPPYDVLLMRPDSGLLSPDLAAGNSLTVEQARMLWQPVESKKSCIVPCGDASRAESISFVSLIWSC